MIDGELMTRRQTSFMIGKDWSWTCESPWCFRRGRIAALARCGLLIQTEYSVVCRSVCF